MSDLNKNMDGANKLPSISASMPPNLVGMEETGNIHTADIERQVFLILCALTGADDEDHEESEIESIATDAIMKIFEESNK